MTHIKFNYLDDDDDSDIVESKVSDKVIEIKPITDNNNSSSSNSYNFNDKNNKDFLDKASDTYQNSIISKAVDYKFTDNSLLKQCLILRASSAIWPLNQVQSTNQEVQTEFLFFLLKINLVQEEHHVFVLYVLFI